MAADEGRDAGKVSDRCWVGSVESPGAEAGAVAAALPGVEAGAVAAALPWAWVGAGARVADCAAAPREVLLEAASSLRHDTLEPSGSDRLRLFGGGLKGGGLSWLFPD